MDGTKDVSQLCHFAEGIRPTADGGWRNAVALRFLPATIPIRFYLLHMHRTYFHNQPPPPGPDDSGPATENDNVKLSRSGRCRCSGLDGRRGVGGIVKVVGEATADRILIRLVIDHLPPVRQQKYPQSLIPPNSFAKLPRDRVQRE